MRLNSLRLRHLFDGVWMQVTDDDDSVDKSCSNEYEDDGVGDGDEIIRVL